MEGDNKKHIAIIYSEVKREYFPTEEQYITEVEVFARAQKVAKYFEGFGYTVEVLAGDENLSEILRKNKWDFPFGFCRK